MLKFKKTKMSPEHGTAVCSKKYSDKFYLYFRKVEWWRMAVCYFVFFNVTVFMFSLKQKDNCTWPSMIPGYRNSGEKS